MESWPPGACCCALLVALVQPVASLSLCPAWDALPIPTVVVASPWLVGFQSTNAISYWEKHVYVKDMVQELVYPESN